jgi:outer membrane protein OmpA-like peptidoglycan-associated protein
MGGHRSPFVFITSILFASSALVSAKCMAQDNSGMQPAQLNADVEGCSDLKALPKLAATHIVSCDKGDSIEVILPMKSDGQGNAREKSVRGHYEFREYRIPEVYRDDQAFLSLMQWIPLAGFTVKYSTSPSTITARKQDTWILVNVSGEYYDVKAVIVPEDPWTPVRDAQGISREMEAHKRVAIYGVEFSPDSQSVIEERSKILGEIVTYLRGNAGLTFDVESHTMSKNGNAEDDQGITRKRAQAVVAWLAAHGIAAGRLRPQAFGRNKPLTENDTLLEIQRNDRIELVQTAP